MTDVVIGSGVTIQKYTPIKYAGKVQLCEWVLNAQRIYNQLGNMGLSYSFQNTSATLIFPTFAPISMGNGTASSNDGGIDIAYATDASEVMVGADGNAVTSMSANRAGTITVSFLKNSPANKLLSALFAIQTTSPNTIGALGVFTLVYSE